MTFNTYGNNESPSLLLIPGLGVSYEIFLPLIELLDECKKVWPYGKGKAVRAGYKDVYTHKLESIHGADIHFWYGTKEAFVAKPQVEHLLKLYHETHVEMFPGMNHGQLLIDHPEEIARRISLLTTL